jgi:hypothetical protein
MEKPMPNRRGYDKVDRFLDNLMIATVLLIGTVVLLGIGYRLYVSFDLHDWASLLLAASSLVSAPSIAFGIIQYMKTRYARAFLFYSIPVALLIVFLTIDYYTFERVIAHPRGRGPYDMFGNRLSGMRRLGELNYWSAVYFNFIPGLILTGFPTCIGWLVMRWKQNRQ